MLNSVEPVIKVKGSATLPSTKIPYSATYSFLSSLLPPEKGIPQQPLYHCALSPRAGTVMVEQVLSDLACICTLMKIGRMTYSNWAKYYVLIWRCRQDTPHLLTIKG